jgi:hypothetical protein
MSDYALQFAAEGLEIPDLPFGEREALTLGAPIDQLDALRKAAIYGYILAQTDINKTITPETSNG